MSDSEPFDPASLAARLKSRDLDAAPTLLNLVENSSEVATKATKALLTALSPAQLGQEAPGHIVGVTGPPGVGKSSLLSQLVKQWRRLNRSVAVLAVDPSSRRSGGSLLGDRARIAFDASDNAVFIRSTAAGERLGGLAAATRNAAQALAVAFDVVVVETVGVGQSETEVSQVADTVVVVVQPGSGDTLQFLKAGIMEIPDVLTVTKADLGTIAQRTVRDLQSALRSLGEHETEIVTVSSLDPPTGIEQLVAATDQHMARLDLSSSRCERRRQSALSQFTETQGTLALKRLGGRKSALDLLAKQPSDQATSELTTALETLLANS